MDRHRTFVAEELARRDAEEQSAYSQRHLLGFARRHLGAIFPNDTGPIPRPTTVSIGGTSGRWDGLMDAIVKAHDGKVQIIDSSIVRVHQHASDPKKSGDRCLGRSRGDIGTKILLARVDAKAARSAS